MCTFWSYSDKTKHVLPAHNRGKPSHQQKMATLKSQQPEFQGIAHKSKSCTTMAIIAGVLASSLTGFAIWRDRRVVFTKFWGGHFFQTLPQGFSLWIRFLLLKLLVVEPLNALPEECRIMIREDLTYIQCQATDSLVPVISGVSLECWIDDG